ncbi:lactonase family protein [Flagellimonas sp. 389]|uniref:lactonase family protein n=1 Tax=Flagellimonas sp. 389 TaxID=2835862 RepID=UPI001BD51CC7|nr:lactonase family protein [Flagellimonas sp. 389]MBS9461844.1 lactonase family protein [Flagellimonas sp. 389]
MNYRIVILLPLLGLLLNCSNKTAKTFLFVGSFTEGKPVKGIHVYEFDTNSGALQLVHEEENTINPSFLKISSNGRHLYSVLESQLQSNGKVAAFAIDSLTGKLELLNLQDSGGRNPAHLAVHPTGNYLINSNYTDAGISVFKINANGSLQKNHQLITFQDSSIVRGRQDEAHLHSTNFSPDGDFLFGQDLGADKIRVFKVIYPAEDTLRLKESGYVAVKPGSGPRHFTFHPNGNFSYGVAELSGTITAYSYTDGKLEYIEDYLSYSKKQDLYRAADIHISPDGKFLYASNRGPEEDSISIFSIDENTGRLTLVGHESTYGEHPRNFCLDPSGNFLLVANQFTNNVVVFKRHSETGRLSKLQKELAIKNPSSLQMRTYGE